MTKKDIIWRTNLSPFCFSGSVEVAEAEPSGGRRVVANVSSLASWQGTLSAMAWAVLIAGLTLRTISMKSGEEDTASRRAGRYTTPVADSTKSQNTAHTIGKPERRVTTLSESDIYIHRHTYKHTLRW